jgi:hypothetical protein
LRRRCLERAGTRQDRAVAVDDPDPSGRPREAVDDLRDLGRCRQRRPIGTFRSIVSAFLRERRDAVGPRGEQARAVVQCGRHCLRSARERSFLGIAQKALQLAHVGNAQPRQRQEHREDEQQLRAYGQRDAGQPHSAFQR